MKNNQFSTRDFFFGLFAGGFIVFLFVYLTGGSINGSQPTQVANTSESASSEESTETMKVYNTSQLESTITSTDSSYTLKAPDGYSSLTDQYLESLKEYYNIETDESNLYVVGNASSQYSADIMINAAPLSKTKELMHTMYDGTDTDVDSLPLSEAYTYMTTGESPAEDSGCVLEELDQITDTQGHTYRVFQVDRDTEYYTDDTQTEKQTVHSTEIAAYTIDSDDPLEIILYMNEWDKDEAIRLLTAFVN